MSGEALQIAVKRREAKSKGEKERYKHLNAEFQRIARRDKKAMFIFQIKKLGFPGGSVEKNPPTNAGNTENMGLILGLGSSPGEANGYPLQYFSLENPMDRGTWQTTVMGL